MSTTAEERKKNTKLSGKEITNCQVEDFEEIQDRLSISDRVSCTSSHFGKNPFTRNSGRSSMRSKTNGTFEQPDLSPSRRSFGISKFQARKVEKRATLGGNQRLSRLDNRASFKPLKEEVIDDEFDALSDEEMEVIEMEKFLSGSQFADVQREKLFGADLDQDRQAAGHAGPRVMEKLSSLDGKMSTKGVFKSDGKKKYKSANDARQGKKSFRSFKSFKKNFDKGEFKEKVQESVNSRNIRIGRQDENF